MISIRTHWRYWHPALAALLLVAQPSPAQPWQWLDLFGTPESDEAYGVAADGAGGAFVAGLTYGSLGGPNGGDSDAFLARYDADGARAWITQFGGDGEQRLFDLTPDGAGGVFAAGVRGPTDEAVNGIVTRYDSQGTQLWLRQFGTAAADWALKTASDESGGMFVAGHTEGNLAGPNAGGWDAFLARYNSAGHRLWIIQFGTPSDERVWGLASDGHGGVFIGGLTLGDLGEGNLGGQDAFVALYDALGTRTWLRQFGTPERDAVYALAPAGDGGAFVAGYTDGDLGGPNAGSSDVFVSRWDSLGQAIWTSQFGSSESDWPAAIVPDGLGGVAVGGGTYGRLGDQWLSLSEAFIAGLDPGGKRIWTTQFGTSNYDFLESMAPDGSGGLFAVGETQGNLGGQNAGPYDAYIAHFVAWCYADLNADGELNVLDWAWFLGDFQKGKPAADCDEDGAFDLFDFLCYVNAFNAGC